MQIIMQRRHSIFYYIRTTRYTREQIVDGE